MKKLISLLLLGLFTYACAQAPTPKVIVVTVVVPATQQLATNTPIPSPTPTEVTTPTATPNPCLLWSRITLAMAGQTICVRGIIRQITYTNNESHWDFTDDRTGFFAVSLYQGWHPITGKSMNVGDCVAITGVIQVLSNGRPYIYWGANSILKSVNNGSRTTYFEHPDLQVIENNPSWCQ